MFKGPFTVRFGATTITDVMDYSPTFDVTSNDYSTIDGRTSTITTGIRASVEVQLRGLTPSAVAAVLPQYYVAQGETLSTGQTVASEDGAIDIVPAACSEEDIANDLDIIDCTGNLAVRINNAVASISSIDMQDGALLTITVAFTGQPGQGEAVAQILGGEDTAVES